MKSVGAILEFIARLEGMGFKVRLGVNGGIYAVKIGRA